MRSDDGLERPRAQRLETRKGEGSSLAVTHPSRDGSRRLDHPTLTLWLLRAALRVGWRIASLSEPQALSHREREHPFVIPGEGAQRRRPGTGRRRSEAEAMGPRAVCVTASRSRAPPCSGSLVASLPAPGMTKGRSRPPIRPASVEGQSIDSDYQLSVSPDILKDASSVFKRIASSNASPSG